jgi:putative flippase GtrA
MMLGMAFVTGITIKKSVDFSNFSRQESSLHNPSTNIGISMTKRDYTLSLLSGLLIGVLASPVLKVAQADLYLKVEFIIIPFLFIATPAGLVIAKVISRRVSIIWEIGKFVVIGILNTLVDWGTLVLLTLSFRKYLTIEPTDNIISCIAVYSLYKSTSFFVATMNSYYWNKCWTFSNPNSKKEKSDLLNFLLASTIGFGINVGVSTYVFSYVRLESFNIDQWGLIGAGLGTLLGLTWNYLAYKFIVFRV